ncbi:recombinase family protein [Zhongshania sp. BJYM1]|uniref:recombinase family protein n=1 Tax=Zhongshania aquatica TaxID=2965069 RepID=UPI0022B2F2CB|nr:recombinase family protein [Marortus sp. BJYM1]
MSRVFAYCRVSTTEQTTENQLLAIRKSGVEISKDRCVSETVSGSTEAMKRSAFRLMVEHSLERGDTLIVLKLDRLGRDAIDVQKTIDLLLEKGVSLRSLDLPNLNLTSAEGKLMLQVFSAFSEFERNRIRERTQEGLERAKASGIKLGRPPAVETTKLVQAAKAEGFTQSKAARLLGISLATVKRHWSAKLLPSIS